MSDTNLSSPYEPKTDLAKMLLVIVEEIGSMQPRAFKDINVFNALLEADRTVMIANGVLSR